MDLAGHRKHRPTGRRHPVRLATGAIPRKIRAFRRKDQTRPRRVQMGRRTAPAIRGCRPMGRASRGRPQMGWTIPKRRKAAVGCSTAADKAA